MKTVLSALVFIIFIAPALKAQISATDRQKYIKLYEAYLNEVDRIDADGLIPRQNRPETWKQTTNSLKKDLRKANTLFDVGRVFRRTDAAYTNLHAHINLDPKYDYYSEGRLQLGVSFWPEHVDSEGNVNRFIISNDRKDYFVHLPPEQRPNVFDEVLAINGRNIKWWQKNNLVYCKFPLLSQCQLNLKDNFRNEVLDWSRREPLSVKLKRGSKIFTVKVPVFARPDSKPPKPEAEQRKTEPRPPPANDYGNLLNHWPSRC